MVLSWCVLAEPVTSLLMLLRQSAFENKREVLSGGVGSLKPITGSNFVVVVVRSIFAELKLEERDGPDFRHRAKISKER